jgi:hypothetical protein
MKIAYLIIAHKNINQLARLINSLSHKNVSFFLHIDAKYEFVETDFELMLKEEADVSFIEPRIFTNWGGYSIVEVTTLLFKACSSIGSFDYINLISGQDFPLVSYDTFSFFLKQNNGYQFLNCIEAPNSEVSDNYFGRARFEKFWHVDDMGLEKSKLSVMHQEVENIKRVVPYDLKIYGGSQWFTITGECLNFILDFIETHPLYALFFKYTLAPDETFFTTIIMNSKFKENAITDNNLRYINWTDGPKYPRILTLVDMDKLIASPHFIARKFDNEIDNQVLIQLERRLNE